MTPVGRATPIHSAVPAVRHPVSTAISLAVVAAIAALFVFARPQYHDAFPGRTIDLGAYPPAAHGWTWQDGQPGYRFDVKEEDWNISRLRPLELEPVKAAAARTGVTDVLPLETERYAPHSLSMIVAGTDSSGATCLGFVLPHTGPSFFCPRSLAGEAGFALVVPNPGGVFLSGIARADVTSVVVHEAGRADARVYSKSGAWGTFSVTLAGGPVRNAANKVIANPHAARLDFFAGRTRLASLSVVFARARERLLLVAG